jgi:hypothetical protein
MVWAGQAMDSIAAENLGQFLFTGITREAGFPPLLEPTPKAPTKAWLDEQEAGRRPRSTDISE